MKHLESEHRPPSAFVSLRPTCAARSIDYPNIIAEDGPRVAAADDDHALVH